MPLRDEPSKPNCSCAPVLGELCRVKLCGNVLVQLYHQSLPSRVRGNEVTYSLKIIFCNDALNGKKGHLPFYFNMKK